MPDTVIARVNHLGKDEPKELVFSDRKGNAIGDVKLPGVELDQTQAPQQNAPAVVQEVTLDDTPVEISDLDNTQINPNNEAPLEPIQEEVPTLQDTPDIIQDTEAVPDAMHDAKAPEEQSAEATAAPAKLMPDPEVKLEADDGPDKIPGVRRSTRVRTKPKDYIPSWKGTNYTFTVEQLETKGALYPDLHLLFQQSMLDPSEPDVMVAIMTQLSLKVGLKQWGKKGHQAAYSEMKQLHFRDTFVPLHWNDLTQEQRLTVLELHMFLKLKRSRDIKGRTVAGGNKQHDFISKEDASSPTVATEAVLLTCIIDAEEGQDVAIIDIPNAFIQTRIEDEKDMVIIRI